MSARVSEAHVRAEAPKMFDAAAKSIVEKMAALRRDIGAQLEKELAGMKREAKLASLLELQPPPTSSPRRMTRRCKQHLRW